MNCDDLGDRLVDSWNEQATEGDREELERHLAECAGCREEADALSAFWQQLGDLDDAATVPSNRLRSRFYSFLAEEQARQSGTVWSRLASWLDAVWPRRPQLQAALVTVALVGGIAVGWLAGRGENPEIAALRAELSAVSESVSISLLTHPAASERLRGVGLTAGAAGDQRIVESLLELVRKDPNINVRLAAIEALAGRLEEPGVKPRLLRTLPEQSSPLLQMTLLDVLLPADGQQVFEAAQPLLEDEALDQAVRERLLEVKGDSA